MFKEKLLILLILLIVSCTEIGVINEDIPFEKKYIVNGRLQAGTNEITISFSKSFAIENDISKDEAALKDLVAYIWSEKQGIFPLKHIGEGNYSPIEELNIIEDSFYELHTKIDNERIYSKTFVPSIPLIEDVSVVENYIICKIIPNDNVVYGCKYILKNKINGNEEIIEDYFYAISRKEESQNKTIEIRTDKLPTVYFDNINRYQLNLEVYAFDKDYYEYYNTRLNNKPVENVFSEGGGSVFWNVNGKNTIGVFIGYVIEEIKDIKID